MKTIVYLIRHGQSVANLNRCFLGHGNLDLTETGFLQAETVAEFLKDVPVDGIYSSDLDRAYHTALPSARLREMNVEKRELLREINGGEWENRPFDELAARESFQRWMANDPDARCDGGESVKELTARIHAAITELAEENLGKTIFIFSHGTPIRSMKILWDKIPLSESSIVPWPGNASVTKTVYENGEFHILEYARDDFHGKNATKLEL